MKDCTALTWFYAIGLLCFILVACAPMKGAGPAQSPVQGTQQPKTTKSEKRIEDHKANYARHPQNEEVLKEYVKHLEEIKTGADRALEREEFSSAARGYRMLLGNYSDFQPFVHKLSFDRAKLNGQLNACKDGLSRKGFHEYRQGNINQAISLWQDYLAIDPHNKDIKKALNTAKLQQKNLQQTR